MIKDENEIKGQGSFQQQQQPFSSPEFDAMDLIDQLGLGASLYSVGGSSEHVEKLNSAIQDYLNASASGRNLEYTRVFPVDSVTAGVPLSSIVAAQMVRSGSRTDIFLCVGLLEPIGHSLSPKLLNSGQNSTLEVPTVPTEVWDDTYYERVKLRVSEAFGVQAGSVNFHDVSSFVIPAYFDVKNEVQVRNLVYCLTSPILICSNPNRFRPISLKNAIGANQHLATRIDWAARQKTDLMARPVRADFVITTTLSRNHVNQAGVDQNLMSMDGFVDIRYAGQQQQQQNGMMMAMMPSTQQYVPEVVITDLNLNFKDFSLDRALFALLQAGSMDHKNAWVRAFQPRARNGRNDIDTRDVGALGMEMPNQGGQGVVGRISTDPTKFGNAELAQLIQTLFYPNLLVSVDIDRSSPKAWIMNHFTMAASGNADARRAIIEAAQTLTGNNFSTNFDPNGTIGQISNIVPLGTWVDAAGQLRDLREFDYLAGLNLLENNQEALGVWRRANENQDMPLEQRLSDMSRILRDRLENVNIVDFGYRVTMSPEFMAALFAGAVAAGLNIRPEGQTNLFGESNNRGNLSLLQSGMGGAGNALFTNNNLGTGRGRDFTIGGRQSTWGK